MTEPQDPEDQRHDQPDQQPTSDPMVELDRAYKAALDSASAFARGIGLGDIGAAAQHALETVRTAADAARIAGDAATRMLPPEARQALADLDRGVRAVQRDAVGPTVGAARLIAESLDSLGALIAEPIGPLPEPLASLVAMAARLAREPVAIELRLPPALRHARLAALVVRDLVAHAGTAESSSDLDRIQNAVDEAVVGAVLRNQAAAPFAEVRVRASVRHDLLSVEVGDGASDRDAEWLLGGARDQGWNLDLVRAEMDMVAFSLTDQGGVLRLERRLLLR